MFLVQLSYILLINAINITYTLKEKELLNEDNSIPLFLIDK